MDIDAFKVINDRYGHLQGDRVLTTLARLFSKLNVENRAYRIGGDEFAIPLPRTSIEEAFATTDRLRKAIERELEGVTITIGITALTAADDSFETLQARADSATYSGKRSGCNSVVVFDDSADDMWLVSPKKIQNLRDLIKGARLDVAFQPIWDVERATVLAYEALARPDARFGFNGPQEAFDLAESAGRVHELDAVCRNSALAVAARTLPGDALLFLNISPQTLNHDRLDPAYFSRAVRAAGLTTDRVVIEITERSITQVGAVIAAAKELQNQGFKLALDDTGAGNSGLEILSRLTFDYVKIDRAVIVSALDDRNARGVLAGIITLSLRASRISRCWNSSATTASCRMRGGVRSAACKAICCRGRARPFRAPKRPRQSKRFLQKSRPAPTMSRRYADISSRSGFG